MTRRLVMGTTPPPIDPIDGDRRARRRTTDRRRGRLGSRLSVRARAFSRYRRSTVRARAMDTNARKNVSVVCLSMQSIRMGKQCDWWRQTPSSAAGGVFVRNRRRRPSTGRERRFERTPRARSFVRSFVRSFEIVVDETTEARRETRQPRATTKTNGQSNRSTDGIRRDVDARRVSSSVSRPSTRRRLRRRFRLRSRARGQRARAGR